MPTFSLLKLFSSERTPLSLLQSTSHNYSALEAMGKRATIAIIKQSMTMLMPIRQAFKSIVPPFERIINESPQLLSQDSSSSLPTSLLMAMLLDQLISPLRRIMPMTALTVLYNEYTPHEIVSLLMHSIKLSIVESTYIKDFLFLVLIVLLMSSS